MHVTMHNITADQTFWIIYFYVFLDFKQSKE